MPTTKKRLNITLSKEVEETLEKISKRDNVPEATKAAALLSIALEIEEDEYFEKIAKLRDTKRSTFVTHKNAWK